MRAHNMEKEFHRQPFPFVEEQPSEADIAEWKRREDLREYVFNRGSAATEGDRQANHSHMMHLHSGPCWCCAHPTSQYNAARKRLDRLCQRLPEAVLDGVRQVFGINLRIRSGQ